MQGSILCCKISISKALLITASAASASSFKIPIQMECSEAWVIKITLISSSDSTSKVFLMSLLHHTGPSRVIKVIFSIWLIPFTGWPLEIEVFEIYVPSASGSKVFLI
jgi:hypothetical protein